MKYISVVVISLSLLLGCQTVNAVASNKQLISKAEETELPTVNGVKTSKPVLCLKNAIVLNHLQRIGEEPYASWYDETVGYPVLLLINKKTGTATLIEYPGMGNIENETFKDMACIVSHGIGTKFFKDKSRKVFINYQKGIDYK